MDTISVEQVLVGDLLLVKEGDIVPVDGIVNVGPALLDEAALTGEFRLVERQAADPVWSGTANGGAPFQMRAMTTAAGSTYGKHLAAIEDSGSMDILCSNKTGTLTGGEMALDDCLDPFGDDSNRTFRLTYVNAFFETGIRSTLDTAILAHRQGDVERLQKVDEIPFDFERRRLSVVVDGPDGRSFITKGAPEPLLLCCTDYEVQGNTRALRISGECEPDALLHVLQHDDGSLMVS